MHWGQEGWLQAVVQERSGQETRARGSAGRTEEANEISDLRDLAARWGQASKGLLPSPPGGTDLSYRVPRGSWLLRVADVME